MLQAAQKGVSGELGHTLMENPIKRIEVKMQGGQDSFNLLAEVNLDLTWAMGPVRHPGALIERISQRMNFIAERGGHIFVRGTQGTQLVISKTVYASLNITTGLIEELTHEKAQLIPPPKAGKEEFDNAMADVIEAVEKSVDVLYETDGKLPPDQELILRPPSQKVNGQDKIGGMFDTTRTPEDLLGKLVIERPNISFKDIGGNEEAKEEIEGLAFAFKHPELYKKWGTRPPKGVMLYGPPGTGKTLLAKALASQADAQFFHVEASDIASKWYGESEKIVKEIFKLANENTRKSIIFFDEIDAIAPRRQGAHEATHKVVSTLLENMDGLQANENVLVVASTNNLEGIEPALLRAGRFDRWVESPLPSEKGRFKIFNIHMAIAEKLAERKLFKDVNFDQVINHTEKYSGADIAEIIRRTLESKVRAERILESMQIEPDLVETEDLLLEIRNYEKIRGLKD